uniref:C2H2-type domain-containing protein n=1 Tax=Oryzias melastigma TaxID=30732 RepID=A0A3B3DRT3_ORYME
MMEIPTYEENEHYEADLNKHQHFNVTDSQDEEGRHEESTSTTDGETDPQNRDQMKTRDGSQIVQIVNSSHMSESQYDSDVRQIFKKTTLVKRHKRSPKENRLSYIKSVDESLKIAQYVSRHIGHDYEERPNVFVCDKCGESFSQSSCLKAHMKTHKEEKPFSCNECDKRFSQKCDLKRHIRTHTGEKPYSCKECSARFSQISSLKRHMRAHAGEKPFSCKECEKSFSRISGLKKHMRTHKEEKPFSCNECDKRFSQKYSNH